MEKETERELYNMISPSFTKRAAILFYSLITIASAVILFTATSAYFISPHIVQIGRTFFGSGKSGCNCTVVASFFGNPTQFAAAGLIAFLIFALWRVAALLKNTNQFVRLKSVSKVTLVPQKLALVLENQPCNACQITVLESKIPVIFCAGFYKPRIYLSTGAIAFLSVDELFAVVSHEEAHRKRREPFRLFLINTITQILWFIPGVLRIGDEYKAYAELVADEYATSGFTKRAFLSSALYKMIRMHEEAVSVPRALSFFEGVMDARIDALTGNAPSFTRAFMKGKVGAGLFGLLFVSSALFMFLSFNRESVSGTEHGACLRRRVEVERRCEFQLMSYAAEELTDL